MKNHVKIKLSGHTHTHTHKENGANLCLRQNIFVCTNTFCKNNKQLHYLHALVVCTRHRISNYNNIAWPIEFADPAKVPTTIYPGGPHTTQRPTGHNIREGMTSTAPP